MADTWGYEVPKRWIRRAKPSSRPDPDVMGDAGPWPMYLPAMWQAIADPTGQHCYPKCPEKETWPLGAAAYWAPLTHLLRYSFGWRGVGEGWQNLEHAGRGLSRLLPDLSPRHHDVRARFLFHVWGVEDLDVFTAWALGREPVIEHVDDPELRDRLSKEGYPLPSLAAVALSAAGGSDPLHLTAHADTSLSSEEEVALFWFENREQHHATLMLDRYAGWGRALDDALDRGLEDWAVDVVVRPVGWLGTYHHSPITGIWFSGDHELHLLGHNDSAGAPRD